MENVRSTVSSLVCIGLESEIEPERRHRATQDGVLERILTREEIILQARVGYPAEVLHEESRAWFICTTAISCA